MKNGILKSVAALMAFTWVAQASAEDIDLFVGPGSSTAADAPNVLFIVDNTGNWTAPFEDEKAAFQSVFDAIKARILDPSDDLAINVGLMMFSETGGDDNNVSGAYVRAAIRPMGDTNSDGDLYAELYSDMIGGLHERDDKANAGAAGLAMAEAYYYFAGKAPYAGNGKAKTDWGVSGTFNEYYNHSNPARATCCAEMHPIWEEPGNALDTKTSTLYNSPVAGGSCGNNYIIWISNGATQDPKAGGSDPIPKQLLAAAITDLGMDNALLTQMGLTPSGSEDTWADEWSRFMKKSPEAVTVFAVDVLPKSTGQGPGWSELLRNMSEGEGVNTGKYYQVTDATKVADELVASINDALDRILAKNSVFASVALPASASAQSTFLNQVFIGQFRPVADASPRWPGNVKQYKLGIDTDNKLKLLDADSETVVDTSENAIIKTCAKSYWSTADSYWSGLLALDLDRVCEEGGVDSTTSNSPDGQHVEKGGQGQQLRAATPASRTVYTCSDTLATCSGTATMPFFNTANTAITNTLLGVASGDRDDTINWGRGADIDNEDGNNDATDMRASVHGDVIHSRPVALNYGTDANPQIVLFYSGNDGMLRAINGNRPDKSGIVNTTGTTPGQEIWSFMPPEFYTQIDVLRQNTDIINFPASTSTAPTTGIPKPYGIDGPITAFDGYVPTAAADKKYLFAGMRRSGRVVYAFDVTTPTAPKMLWKKGCPDLANDTGCTPTTGSDWEKIGQTWSQPNLLYAKGYNDGTDYKPMLIMGGGYDDCEDTDNNSTNNHSCASGTKGNVIYVLDAYDGTVLKTFTTDRAVPGAVTVVPYGEGLDTGIKFAYATDAGGNVYRIHGGTTAAPTAIDATAPASWQMTKIASLGCSTPTTCVGNRKFLFGPDILRIPDTVDEYAVIVGSGDREKPLEAYGAANAISNFFFVINDKPTVSTWLTDETTNCGSAVICLASLTAVTTAGVPTGVTLSTKGWRLPLATGEQVVTGAITVASVANFSTHIPADSSDACDNPLGTATAYNLNYADGAGDTTNIVGGGLVPTPVAGMVILDDGSTEPFCIGCGGEESAIGAKLVGSGITWTQPKSRVYWNIQQ